MEDKIIMDVTRVSFGQTSICWNHDFALNDFVFLKSALTAFSWIRDWRFLNLVYQS